MADLINIVSENDFPQWINKVETKFLEIRKSGVFKSFDNATIAYEYYLADNARGSIVITHGFTEFMAKYYEMTEYFLEAGFNVFLYDCRGHGLSERETEDVNLVHINSFDEYARDLDEYLNKVVNIISVGLPTILLGHSMGGAIVLKYICEYDTPVDKAIMSSPMFFIHTKGICERALSRIINSYGRKHGMNNRFIFSRDFNPQVQFDGDPWVSKNRFEHYVDIRKSSISYQTSCASSQWMRCSLDIEENFKDGNYLAKGTAKSLILSAGIDKSVKVRPQKKVSDKLPNSTLIRFKKTKHCLYSSSEEALNEYYRAIFDFLNS